MLALHLICKITRYNMAQDQKKTENLIAVKVLAKCFIDGRYYEAGETANIEKPKGGLPKHLEEAKEEKKD